MQKDTIVGVWMGGDGTIKKATEQGHRVILSSCWYLDHLDDDWIAMYKCEVILMDHFGDGDGDGFVLVI